MRLRLFVLLLSLAALLLAPAAQAAPPQGQLAPTALRWVDAALTFQQPTLTTMQVGGEFSIYRYDFDGETYDADEIGARYHALPPSGKDVFLAAFEAAVRRNFVESLAESFPDAVQSGVAVSVDRSTLVAASGDPYTPAVRASAAATLARTPEAMGLGSFSPEAVAAAFDAGARVGTTLSLSSPAGQATTYTVSAPSTPAGLAFGSIQGATLSPDGRSFTVTVDGQRSTGAPAVVSATLHKPSVSAPAAEDVRTTIEIRLGAPDAASGLLPIATGVTAELRAANVGERFPSLLPANVELDFVSADGMRGLRNAGALTDAHVARANEAFLSTIRENLTRTLGSAVSATGGLSGTDLAAAPGSGAPVRFLANASGGYPLPAGSAEKLGVGLDIGAEVSFHLNLFGAPRQATTFVVHPVPGAGFTQALNGTVPVSGATATYTVPAGVGAYPTTLAMRGANARSYDAEDATLDVVVDLKDLDITIGKAMDGDMGNLLMDVTVTGNLGVIKVPEDLKAGLLPRNERVSVSLDYLSSDAVRLLRQRGLVSDANLSVLEERLLADVQQKLGSALGAGVEVTGGFDEATLAPPGSTRLSGDEPIVFQARTSISKPLSGGAPSQQAAIALYTQSQTFTLPKVQGLDTSYTVILPRGFAVTDLQATGGEYRSGKAADGRDSFTVEPTDSTAQATVAMSVTPTFVLVKFWPIVLLAVLLLVLLVGAPIALVMRRRKK